MAMFKRLRRRDSAFEFFDRFGDPDEPSAGTMPFTKYPDVAIDAIAQIRVVQLLPGGFEDEIRCRLDTMTLADTGEISHLRFAALSYTWGGFANPGHITLNGVTGFPVSQNLYCCLQRLRSMEQSQWFWIDQICINQHDKEEKSVQVDLMTDIYTQATQVIIWLGDHAPGSQLSSSRSDQLEKIVEYASFGRKDMGLCWWRRLWVLQEYSLSSKEPLVQIGSEQVAWTDLCQFASSYLEGAHSFLPAANSFGVLHDMIQRFSEVRKTPRKDCTLLALAWIFPQLICFDPRDKIYGLRGLLPSDLKAVIKTDYERADTKSVFSHATYAEISYTKSLGVMALVRRKHITTGLPSWVVDFVYPQDLEHMHIPNRIGIWLDHFRRPPHSWTHAAPRTDVDVEYDVESMSLTIIGLDLDQVLFALPIVDAEVSDVPQTVSWQKMALASNSLTSRFVLRKEERRFRREVLAPLESQTAYRRLVSGKEAYPSPVMFKEDGIRRILAEAIMVDWLYHDAHGDEKCIEDELEQDDAFPAALDGYFDHLAGDFDTSGLSTSFFITSKGFVGVGPRHMRPGHRIVLPYGSRYPMLVQPNVDNNSEFLGFVHVTGLGNDQLLTLVPDLRLREQRYVLRQTTIELIFNVVRAEVRRLMASQEA